MFASSTSNDGSSRTAPAAEQSARGGSVKEPSSHFQGDAIVSGGCLANLFYGRKSLDGVRNVGPFPLSALASKSGAF
jgi:hypothetical protein